MLCTQINSHQHSIAKCFQSGTEGDFDGMVPVAPLCKLESPNFFQALALYCCSKSLARERKNYHGIDVDSQETIPEIGHERVFRTQISLVQALLRQNFVGKQFPHGLVRNKMGRAEKQRDFITIHIPFIHSHHNKGNRNDDWSQSPDPPQQHRRSNYGREDRWSSSPAYPSRLSQE